MPGNLPWWVLMLALLVVLLVVGIAVAVRKYRWRKHAKLAESVAKLHKDLAAIKSNAMRLNQGNAFQGAETQLGIAFHALLEYDLNTAQRAFDSADSFYGGIKWYVEQHRQPLANDARSSTHQSSGDSTEGESAQMPQSALSQSVPLQQAQPQSTQSNRSGGGRHRGVGRASWTTNGPYRSRRPSIGPTPQRERVWPKFGDYPTDKMNGGKFRDDHGSSDAEGSDRANDLDSDSDYPGDSGSDSD